MRYQDPKIEKHGDWYVVRACVTTVQNGSVVRKRRRIQLARIDDGLQVARKRKGEVMAVVNAGHIVAQSQILFRDLVDQYRKARIPALSFGTQRKYESHLVNHLLPAFGDLTLVQVTRLEVEKWLAGLDKLAYATRLDLKRTLVTVFNCAIEWHLWDGNNPASRVRMGTGAPKRDKPYLAPEKLVRFLACIANDHVMDHHKAQLIARLALYGGLRASEILALRAEDIEQDHICIQRRVYRGDVSCPKTKSSIRKVFIGSLADELRAICTAGFIFTGFDGEVPDHREIHKYAFKPAAVAAGIDFEGFGLHTLRRHGITLRQFAGASPIEVMRWAGHKSLQMTALYTMQNREREKEITEKVIGMVQ